MINLIKRRLIESSEIKKSISQNEEMLSTIFKIAQIMIDSLKNQGKIFFCGNGGSAADAQHLATELQGKFYKERAALAGVALNTNSSILTAIGNDYGYSRVFERQIEALGKTGDVLVGISTSGNSENIILAFEKAKQLGITTIALTGLSGGKLKSIADILVAVPSADTPRVQESHITIGHIICEMVESEIFG